MGMTEEQFDAWWKELGIEFATFAEKSAARKGWNAAIAALPKPEAVEVTFKNIETDEWHKKTFYTEAPIAQPASGPTGFDAEFLAKRLGRVAKLAGVSMPENFTHEQVAEAAGTILGQISAAIEDRAKQLDSLLARLEVISEVHVISATYDRIRTERIFAADDLEYDLFATGMKTAIEMMKGGA